MSKANLRVYYLNEIHSLKVCSEYARDECMNSRVKKQSWVIEEICTRMHSQYEKQSEIFTGMLAMAGFDDTHDVSHVMEGITISKEFMLYSSHDKDTDDVILIKEAGSRCSYFRHSFVNCAAIASELEFLDHRNIFLKLSKEQDKHIKELNMLAIKYIYPKAAKVSNSL